MNCVKLNYFFPVTHGTTYIKDWNSHQRESITIRTSNSWNNNMKVLMIIALALVIAVAQSDAWCLPGKGGGTLSVCKSSGKVNCIGVGSTDTCVNLVGGPFVSGYSSGSYSCTIFSNTGCSGTSISVDKTGWTRFPITPKSMKCPCV